MIPRFVALIALGSLLVAAGSQGVAAGLPNAGYTAHCQMCHQSHGEGLPGQFPRLIGRVDKIAATPQGRRYLILVVLHGIAGAITVEDTKIVGVMPGVPMLSDAQIASILTALSATGGRRPPAFTAAEVAKIRGEGPSSGSRTMAERARLAEAGLIP